MTRMSVAFYKNNQPSTSLTSEMKLRWDIESFPLCSGIFPLVPSFSVVSKLKIIKKILNYAKNRQLYKKSLDEESFFCKSAKFYLMNLIKAGT